MKRGLTLFIVTAMIMAALMSTPPPGYWMPVARLWANEPAWSDGILYEGHPVRRIMRNWEGTYNVLLDWTDKRGRHVEWRRGLVPSTRLFVIDWEKYA